MDNQLYKKIKRCFQTDKILYSQHALFEMMNEEFGLIADVEVLWVDYTKRRKLK